MASRHPVTVEFSAIELPVVKKTAIFHCESRNVFGSQNCTVKPESRAVDPALQRADTHTHTAMVGQYYRHRKRNHRNASIHGMQPHRHLHPTLPCFHSICLKGKKKKHKCTHQFRRVQSSSLRHFMNSSSFQSSRPDDSGNIV